MGVQHQARAAADCQAIAVPNDGVFVPCFMLFSRFFAYQTFGRNFQENIKNSFAF
jgi:hypothetical protein